MNRSFRISFFTRAAYQMGFCRCLGPDLPHQILFLDDLASVLDQHNQHLKGFGGNGKRGPALSMTRSTVSSRKLPNS